MSKYSYKPHASYWLRDWEDDDNETIAHQATLAQDEIRYEFSKNKLEDYDRRE